MTHTVQYFWPAVFLSVHCNLWHVKLFLSLWSFAVNWLLETWIVEHYPSLVSCALLLVSLAWAVGRQWHLSFFTVCLCVADDPTLLISDCGVAALLRCHRLVLCRHECVCVWYSVRLITAIPHLLSSDYPPLLKGWPVRGCNSDIK